MAPKSSSQGFLAHRMGSTIEKQAVDQDANREDVYTSTRLQR
jgi:hypothetical protein